MNVPAYRSETDRLRKWEIPADVYDGVLALNATGNFPITRQSIASCFSLAGAPSIIGEAAALANRYQGFLDEGSGQADVAACCKFRNGALHTHVVVNQTQGDARTLANMSSNEVFADRALAIWRYALSQCVDSSIMPSKASPAIPEAVSQAALNIIDNGLVIIATAKTKQLQLGPSEPIDFVIPNSGLTHLGDSCGLFTEKHIRGVAQSRVGCGRRWRAPSISPPPFLFMSVREGTGWHLSRTSQAAAKPNSH